MSVSLSMKWRFAWLITSLGFYALVGSIGLIVIGMLVLLSEGHLTRVLKLGKNIEAWYVGWWITVSVILYTSNFTQTATLLFASLLISGVIIEISKPKKKLKKQKK